MIPLATTTVTTSRLESSDVDAEPYSGEGQRYREHRRHVNAVINPPNGREQYAGGEQNIIDAELICDPIDLDRLDQVTDDTTGWTYRVVWVWTIPGDHTEAGLHLVQGEV